MSIRIWPIPYLLQPDGTEAPDALDYINQNFHEMERLANTVDELCEILNYDGLSNAGVMRSNVGANRPQGEHDS